MWDPLMPPVAGLKLQFHTNWVEPGDCTLSRVERHPYAAQAFLPLDVGRYLVTVFPAAPDGGPERRAAKSFVVPGNRGVIYRQGIWHAGISVLDDPGSFAVLMWRGAPDDDQFADIAPLMIDIPSSR
ncbi:hypothetical protein DRW48_00795 [Paracoccus suum]|uniref:Ureidoglycolate hydrolase n=2 Tax=Paracoccus suum TaxID=2259340 RepID=A0A344PGC4_9RHOB|nr:hypothetical protein DRW48_00795 [Paracoccus suum]